MDVGLHALYAVGGIDIGNFRQQVIAKAQQDRVAECDDCGARGPHSRDRTPVEGRNDPRKQIGGSLPQQSTAENPPSEAPVSLQVGQVEPSIETKGCVVKKQPATGRCGRGDAENSHRLLLQSALPNG